MYKSTFFVADAESWGMQAARKGEKVSGWEKKAVEPKVQAVAHEERLKSGSLDAAALSGVGLQQRLDSPLQSKHMSNLGAGEAKEGTRGRLSSSGLATAIQEGEGKDKSAIRCKSCWMAEASPSPSESPTRVSPVTPRTQKIQERKSWIMSFNIAKSTHNKAKNGSPIRFFYFHHLSSPVEYYVIITERLETLLHSF